MKLRYESDLVRLYEADCISWLRDQPERSIQAVVTDPPYGLVEYTDVQLEKRRSGQGGIWRIPPNFDGHTRAPMPRFSALTDQQMDDLGSFFLRWGKALLPRLTPGAHIFVASTPLLSHVVSHNLFRAGFERRGEVMRRVLTFRGGDRPKGAEAEFPEVSTIPRGNWEPWLLFRRPLEGTVAESLREWKTGGLRRPDENSPFSDLLASGRTPRRERDLADHPSLKPQAFLRQIVRASLPLGEGTVLDPFAGSGSTLAAAEAVGYRAVGIELDASYVKLACKAIPKLAELEAVEPGRPVPVRPLSRERDENSRRRSDRVA